MDLFSLPPVVQDGKTLDTLIVCVDRHSGWIVAIPERKVGLTGAKVALAMVKHQWRPFGVPSVITSDQGPSLWAPGGKPCVGAWGFAVRFLKHTTIGPTVGPKGPASKFLSA